MPKVCLASASGISYGVEMPAARPSLGLRKMSPLLHVLTPELDEIRYGTKRPDGLTIADINGLSVQLPKSFQIRHMEDNQATITLLLSGQAGVLRHTDRTQRVSFGWLKQQYENGEFRLLNVGTAEQTADVFTKPFTEKSKWIHALRLIGHTSSAHAGCKPVSSKGEVKTTTAAVSDGIKVVEDYAKSALESKKLDFPTFEKLASLIRQHLKSSLSRARPLMTQDNQSSYLVFGAWVHGGPFWHHEENSLTLVALQIC